MEPKNRSLSEHLTRYWFRPVHLVLAQARLSHGEVSDELDCVSGRSDVRVASAVRDHCPVTSNSHGRRATRASPGFTKRLVAGLAGFAKRHVAGLVSVVGVAITGALVAVVIGWTGIDDWRPFCDVFRWCVASPQESDDSSSDPSVQPSPNPPSPSAATPSPTVSQMLVSDRPTEYLARGTLTLSEGSSSVVNDWGFRVSTGYIFDTFARIRASTDAGPCETLLNVGDSMVLSNRPSGGTDYSKWYAVVLTSTTDGQATLEWSVGSGAAPVTVYSNSCV